MSQNNTKGREVSHKNLKIGTEYLVVGAYPGGVNIRGTYKGDGCFDWTRPSFKPTPLRYWVTSMPHRFWEILYITRSEGDDGWNFGGILKEDIFEKNGGSSFKTASIQNEEDGLDGLCREFVEEIRRERKKESEKCEGPWLYVPYDFFKLTKSLAIYHQLNKTHLTIYNPYDKARRSGTIVFTGMSSIQLADGFSYEFDKVYFKVVSQQKSVTPEVAKTYRHPGIFHILVPTQARTLHEKQTHITIISEQGCVYQGTIDSINAKYFWMGTCQFTFKERILCQVSKLISDTV